MPDVTGLGDYTESGQVAMVRHGDEAGEFTLGMYVDSLPAIASGREVAAYPKKLGKPRLCTDSDTLVGTLDYGSIQVALATMGYKHRALDEAQARAELTAPTFMLKIVPGYDGRPRICELVRFHLEEITLKEAWTGPAALGLFPHALADVARLPVREVVSALHFKADLTLGLGHVAFDYLAK